MTKEFFNRRAMGESDDFLLEEIARQAIGTEYSRELVSSGAVQAGEAAGFDSLENLRALGEKIFDRISHEMYDLFCGKGNSSVEQRSQLTEALGISDLAGLGFLTDYLSGHLHMSAALAAATAALLLKRIISPAGTGLCEFWRSKL